MQCTTGCRGRREAIGRELWPAADMNEKGSNLDKIKQHHICAKYKRKIMYDDTSDACMVRSRKGSGSKRYKRILLACSGHAPDMRATFLSCISHTGDAYLMLTL